MTQVAIPSHPSDYSCIDLVNSRFTDHLGTDAVTDRLRSREWQAWFLDYHGLTPDHRGAAPTDQLERLRLHVGTVLQTWAAGRSLSQPDMRALDRWISAAHLRQRVATTPHGIRVDLEPVRRDWEWVMASIAASAAGLIAEGDPQRLKRCGNPDCSWMYYDTTLNGAKRYCSATPCGTLMRVRRFRSGVE